MQYRNCCLYIFFLKSLEEVIGYQRQSGIISNYGINTVTTGCKKNGFRSSHNCLKAIVMKHFLKFNFSATFSTWPSEIVTWQISRYLRHKDLNSSSLVTQFETQMKYSISILLKLLLVTHASPPRWNQPWRGQGGLSN